MAIREYQLPTKTYNADALHADILSALTAAKFGGIVGRKGTYWALLTDAALAADETTVTTIATNHSAANLTASQQAALDAQTMRSAVLADFTLSALVNKTPAQIETYLQGEIDAWASLADAKTDLRAWLPLMAKAIVFLLRREQT